MSRRGADTEGLARAKSKERSDFAQGKTGAGINDRGDARKGFGPSGTGPKCEPVVGTASGYKGGKQ